MNGILVPADVLAFIGAGVFGLAAALLASRRFRRDKPSWPLALYLVLMDASFIGSLMGGYSKTRTRYSWREQFLANFFVYAFIGFVFVLVFVVKHCGRRGC